MSITSLFEKNMLAPFRQQAKAWFQMVFKDNQKVVGAHYSIDFHLNALVQELSLDEARDNGELFDDDEEKKKKVETKEKKEKKEENVDTLHVYTDGSCKGNPGPGGWGFVFVQPKAYEEDMAMCGKLPAPSTNNRAELMALIKALETLVAMQYRADTVVVFSDSQYVLKCATGKWKKKSNLDLWQRYARVQQKCLQKVMRTLKFEWVKGHNGNLWNEKVDKLAKSQCL